MSINKFIVKNLGLVEYSKTWQEMKNFTATRNSETKNEIWFLEHSAVFTQGQAGRPEHILNPGNIPIVQTDRGGQVTYHGPGQLIAYVLYDLRRGKTGVKEFVNLLHAATVNMLADFNIPAFSKEDAPGVYVEKSSAKICSLGLKISRGASYHGLALNVHNDLSPFLGINPCGYKNLVMTKMADYVNVTMEEVALSLQNHLIKKLEKK
jgi:lipoyl(octanoyl) transferase